MCISGSYAQRIIEGPQNTAAKFGQPAQLNCTVDRGLDTFQWTHFLYYPTGTRIYDSNTGDIRDPRFDVVRPGSGEYHLVIKEAHSNLTGRYQCGLIIVDQRASAQFVTISKWHNVFYGRF